MDSLNSKLVKIGYRYGLILLIFGLVIVGINVIMIYTSNEYFPKLLTVGIAISLFAPIFFVFPGGSLDKMPETKDMRKTLVKNAPAFHKVIWIV